jgi:hypothetical protein
MTERRAASGNEQSHFFRRLAVQIVQNGGRVPIERQGLAFRVAQMGTSGKDEIDVPDNV